MNKLNRLLQGLTEISLHVHNVAALRRYFNEVSRIEVLRGIDLSKDTSRTYQPHHI